MSLPTITDTIGGYDFDWVVELVCIEVRRLKFQSDDLKGELTISSTAPSVKNNHLHRAAFNFSSSQMRTRLAKDLQEKAPDFDWAGMLEQVCFYTLDRHRRGDTAVEIDSSQIDIKPPEYLLHPFLIKNYPSIFFGDPSSGKSLISQVVTAMVTLPWNGNPLNWAEPNKPLSVLFLDWETDKDTISWTARCLTNGMGLGSYYFHYRRCGRPLHDDVEQIAEWVVDTKADITIIDSLGMAVGGDLNATEPALNFWAAWRQLKTTSLILAHTRKDNGDGAARTVYGNQYYTAEARCVWEVKKVQDAGDNCLDIALFNRKPPPFGKLHQPMGLHFEFDDEGEHGISRKVIVSEKRPESVGEFVKGMGNHGAGIQILDALKTGAMTPEDLSSELDININNTRVAITRLKEKGKITKLQDGRYGLSYT